MGLEMLAALLASSQLAVYAGVIWRNLNFKKEIEKVLFIQTNIFFALHWNNIKEEEAKHD